MAPQRVRPLGEAASLAALSPDGKWVLTKPPGGGSNLVLLPTGAGEARTVAFENISNFYSAHWFPDGERLVFQGSEPSHGFRLYVCPATGGKPRAISPEGFTASYAISPDGRFVAAAAGPNVRLYPVGGGEARAIQGAAPGDLPIGWTADARAVFVVQTDGATSRVYRLDVSSGRRELWREITPSDPAGVMVHTAGMTAVLPTNDWKGHFLYYNRMLSELYLVEGLR